VTLLESINLALEAWGVKKVAVQAARPIQRQVIAKTINGPVKTVGMNSNAANRTANRSALTSALARRQTAAVMRKTAPIIKPSTTPAKSLSGNVISMASSAAKMRRAA
jgi:hypothetical protein